MATMKLRISKAVREGAIEILQCAADLVLNPASSNEERAWPATCAAGSNGLDALNGPAWLLAYQARYHAAKAIQGPRRRSEFIDANKINDLDTLLEAAALLLEGWDPAQSEYFTD
jgi:hypothetical protein